MLLILSSIWTIFSPSKIKSYLVYFKKADLHKKMDGAFLNFRHFRHLKS